LLRRDVARARERDADGDERERRDAYEPDLRHACAPLAHGFAESAMEVKGISRRLDDEQQRALVGPDRLVDAAARRIAVVAASTVPLHAHEIAPRRIIRTRLDQVLHEDARLALDPLAVVGKKDRLGR